MVMMTSLTTANLGVITSRTRAHHRSQRAKLVEPRGKPKLTICIRNTWGSLWPLRLEAGIHATFSFSLLRSLHFVRSARGNRDFQGQRCKSYVRVPFQVNEPM